MTGTARRQPLLAAGVVVAALLALRAAAPLVSPPPAVVEAGWSRPAVPVAAPSRPAELAEATGARLLLGGKTACSGSTSTPAPCAPSRFRDGGSRPTGG